VRALVANYQAQSPAGLREALEILARDPGKWRPLAGGTDLMVLFEAGRLPFKNLLNILSLAELKGIEVSSSEVKIGALSTFSQIQAHPVLVSDFPLLCQAGRETGALAIQNRGTLGGNIANASPAADSPPALLVYDAQVELVSVSGSRWVDYRDFHSGYKKMNLQPHELIRCVKLPRRKEKWIHSYRKVGTRKAQAISKVCFAAGALLEGGVLKDIRLALGSVAPLPLRCLNTEEFLRGKAVGSALESGARQALLAEITPIDDIRSTSLYRREVAANLLLDFLRSLSDGS
jgi:CO/xanthine dehydrogenase FAD-binding subunit